MQIRQKVIKRKRIIIPMLIILLIFSSILFMKLLLNRMNRYIDENGKSSMGAVVEQIQQTYELQVNGYYSQLHLVEDYILKEKEVSPETDANQNFFEAWEKEAGSRLVFLQENGERILNTFEQSAPGEYDMILMDVQMPVMNGYEATKAIRRSTHKLAKTIPIIAMTANAFSEDIQHSLAAGMNAHISKPVEMKVLKKTIRNIKFGEGEYRNAGH